MGSLRSGDTQGDQPVRLGRALYPRGLIDQMQQLATGLAADRKPVGEAVSALSELTTVTAGLLTDVRPPLAKDIAALNDVSRNLAEHGDTVDKFLNNLPHKLATITRSASYGSWFNYFLCSAHGKVGISSLGIIADIPAWPAPGVARAERCGP